MLGALIRKIHGDVMTLLDESNLILASLGSWGGNRSTLSRSILTQWSLIDHVGHFVCRLLVVGLLR